VRATWRAEDLELGKPAGRHRHERALACARGAAHEPVSVEAQGAEAPADWATGQRLYQLIRQAGPITDRTFEISFADPDIQVYAFTFG